MKITYSLEHVAIIPVIILITGLETKSGIVKNVDINFYVTEDSTFGLMQDH